MKVKNNKEFVEYLYKFCLENRCCTTPGVQIGALIGLGILTEIEEAPNRESAENYIRELVSQQFEEFFKIKSELEANGKS